MAQTAVDSEQLATHQNGHHETIKAEKHSPITVRKVAGHIGAEISGVNVSGDLPEETIAAIRKALLDHRVVFFRGQHHLDDATQAAFARRFGKLTLAHPTVPSVKEDRNVLPIDGQKPGGKATTWHTDVTCIDRPPAMSFLRAITLPPYGGDTTWANTVSAYESLAPPLRTLAESLWAFHSNSYAYNPDRSERDDRHHREVFASTVYETEHPVVSIHPETGERALLLGNFVRRFVGVSSVDSQHLFELFQHHVTRLENTVRWQWALGDLAIWDNRSTQHRAIDDYGDLPRRLHRVTIGGDYVKGVEGQRSRVIKGNSDNYLTPEA